MLNKGARIVCSESKYLSGGLVLEIPLHLPGEVVQVVSGITNSFVEGIVLLFPRLLVSRKLFGLVLEVLVQKEAALS